MANLREGWRLGRSVLALALPLLAVMLLALVGGGQSANAGGIVAGHTGHNMADMAAKAASMPVTQMLAATDAITVDVAIQNFAFAPQVLTITVGTAVRWTNQDSDGHTATSDTNAFDSGFMAQNATYEHLFNTVGQFAYHCEIHSFMTGTIVVVAEGGTATDTPTVTPSATETATVTPTGTPTVTPTGKATLTPTPIPTQSPTLSPTSTTTPAATVTPCPISFSDVPGDNPFHAAIICLACHEIVSGYSDGTFAPFNGVTRAQVAKIVANAAGEFRSIPADRQTFEDVPPGHPFWIFIERAFSRGVLNGYTCGQAPAPDCVGPANRPYFLPATLVTRGQLAKIVANTAGFNETPTGQTFEDVPPSNTFYLFIERAAMHGLINGYTCGQGPAPACVGPANRPDFLPFNGVTRGQTAKIVSIGFLPECGIR